jgi:hypothetical protein
MNIDFINIIKNNILFINILFFKTNEKYGLY